MLMNSNMLSAAPQSKLLSSIIFFMTSFEKIQQFYNAFFPSCDEEEEDKQQENGKQNEQNEQGKQGKQNKQDNGKQNESISNTNNNTNDDNTNHNDEYDHNGADDKFIEELRAAFDTEPVDVKEVLLEYSKLAIIVCSFFIIRRIILSKFNHKPKKIKHKSNKINIKKQ